jgi:ribosomal protein S18 acetylase RimI-like enzyme
MVLITPLSLDRHDLQLVAELIIESAPELFSAMFGRQALVILQALIRRSHNRFSHRYIWVAEADSGVVGVVAAVPSENLRNAADYATVLNRWQRLRLALLNRLILSRTLRQNYPPKTFYIANLAVAPTHRSQGIGTQLVQRCIDQANEQRAIALYISVDIDNPQAQKLYERLGFQVVEKRTLSLLKFTIGTRVLRLEIRNSHTSER